MSDDDSMAGLTIEDEMILIRRLARRPVYITYKVGSIIELHKVVRDPDVQLLDPEGLVADAKAIVDSKKFIAKQHKEEGDGSRGYTG